MQCLLLSAAPVTHIYHLLPHLRDFYTQTPTTVTWNLVPLKSTSLVFFFFFILIYRFVPNVLIKCCFL